MADAVTGCRAHFTSEVLTGSLTRKAETRPLGSRLVNVRPAFSLRSVCLPGQRSLRLPWAKIQITGDVSESGTFELIPPQHRPRELPPTLPVLGASFQVSDNFF